MQMPRNTVLALVAAALVAGCGGGRDGDVTLRKIRNTGNGPDEFSILPGKPLEMPADVSSLPAPAPGARNRTDRDPVAEGIAALGGTAGAGVGAGTAGLVSYAGRYGSTPAVRQQLAVEDREIRRRYGNVNVLSILPGDDYTQAYSDQWLDADREQERLRRSGVRVPSAPPPAR